MARLTEFTVHLPGGRRAETTIRGHRLLTDQPLDNGGDDAAPTPYEFLLASVGTCVAVTLQGFAAKRALPVEGTTVKQSMRYDDAGLLQAVDLEVTLPPDYPEKYREAALRAAGECSVKKAIAASPTFTVHLASGTP
jgi:ribosomal protein S12 methylthiotransferase accessory factor